MADGSPFAHSMAGSAAVPIGHAIALAQLFPGEGRAHDALVVETRRHLGGCITAVETALRLAVASDSPTGAGLAHHPGAQCWPMVRAHPGLIGPALLAHMQMRGGVSLMLRQFGRPDGERPDAAEAAELLPEGDPGLADAMTKLTLAEARWSANGADDEPLILDLPAEYFTELLWTAVACLTTVLVRSTLTSEHAAIMSLDQAAQSLLVRHDEASSPVAAADALMLRLGAQAEEPTLLGRALAQRRFILFAALAGRHARLATERVIDILLSGAMEHVAALCRSLGGSSGDYRHLLLALRPVRPALTDGRVLAEADCYDSLSEPQAEQVLGILRAPAALRAQLDHLRRASAP
ncbi:DUF2336 domain-containing protein [Sphingobium sp. AN558]|uniref:DUF2336 domain-containing protein n=1 Tax=Sphingobium sp. AN558 TaxID=3133442 RepID=UPI0030C3758A